MPNPTRGEFVVAYYGNVSSTYALRIYDAKGALVFNRTYPATTGVQRMAVDIRQHGHGVYFVVLDDMMQKKKVTTAKLVVAIGNGF